MLNWTELLMLVYAKRSIVGSAKKIVQIDPQSPGVL